MTDSHLHVYSAQHHNCKTLGELHGLADAMRSELLARIAELEAKVERMKVCGNCAACSTETTFTDHEYGADGFHHECGTPYTFAEDGTESQVEWRDVFAFVEMGDHCWFTPSRWAEGITT